MKVKCTLHSQPDQYAEGGYSFSVFNSEDMSMCGYTALDTVEVEFTVPPRDVMVNGAIAAFRKKQQEIRAEAEAKAQSIEEQIQRLLCIEHRPEVEA